MESNKTNWDSLMKPYKKKVGNLSSLMLDKEVKDSDREYIVKFKHFMSQKAYWLKAYQSNLEKILMPVIQKIPESMLIAYSDKNLLEKAYEGPELNQAVADGLIHPEKASELLAKFYSNIHRLGFVFDDRLADHTVYLKRDNKLKITDFGAVHSLKRVINYNTNQIIDIANSNSRQTPYSSPCCDIIEALSYICPMNSDNALKVFRFNYVFDGNEFKTREKYFDDALYSEIKYGKNKEKLKKIFC